jgi:tight adherence protein B
VIAVIGATCAFLAVMLAIGGNQGRRSFGSGSERRLRALKREASTERSSESLIRRAPSSIPFLRTLVSGEWGERMRLDLERADMGLRPGEFVALRVALAIIPLLMFLLILGPVMGLIAGLLVGGLGSLLPVMYLRSRTGRRTNRVSEQLTEFLRFTANSLRTGYALLQALDSAARELDAPLSDELKRLLLDTSMGANTDDALRRFADRINTYEVRSMVTAILVQRTTGGNLAEVMDNVAETMEERQRIQGEVRSFTAQQRMTGNILSVYPLILGAFFTLIHPSLMSLLWTDSVGVVLLVIALSLQLAGFLVIRRILDVDY